MGKVRLLFKGITEIVGTDRMGLILLTDAREERQVSIVCDRQMIFQFVARMEHTPVVEKMLPEVLWQVVRSQSGGDLELIINDVHQGQYNALLYNTETYDYYPLRASDAVLLSYISKMPLYMEEGLMMRQSVPYKVGAVGISLPLNAISDKMLDAAMEKAISTENYELASQLRDEMQRRKGAQGGGEA